MKKKILAVSLYCLLFATCNTNDDDNINGNNNNSSGQKWVQTNGPSGGTVYDVVSDGINSFVGTASGVYRSVDNGATWIGVRNGMGKYDCRSVVISNSKVYTTSTGGVYMSSNNGDSWTAVGNVGAIKLVVSGAKLYSVGGNGVKVTTDNGSTWSALNNGLGVAANSTQALAVNGNTMVVGTNGYGVFVSANGGSNWAEANNGLPNKYVNAVLVNGTSLFVGTSDGAFLSSDNGATWNLITDIHTANISADEVFSFYAQGTTIYACTNGGGLFKSSDNGLSWATSNTGLDNHYIWALNSCGTKLLAATWGDGIYASTNFGNSWASSTEGIAEIGSDLFVNGNNVYISTLRTQTALSHFSGLYATADNGNHWTSQTIPLDFNNTVKALAFSGVYSFMSGYGTGKMYRSADGGNTWAQTPLPSNTINKIQTNGSTIFAGTDNGVFRSTDDGTSWTSLTGSGLPSGSQTAIAVSSSKAVIAANGRIYCSLDNGVTWNNVLAPGVVYCMLVKDNRIFAGTNGNGMQVSDNNGVTWTAVTNGFSDNHFASLTTDGVNVFAADFSGHVYKSTDNGNSWSNISDGLVTSGSVLTSLAVKDNYLYAATGYGVWKWTL